MCMREKARESLAKLLKYLHHSIIAKVLIALFCTAFPTAPSFSSPATLWEMPNGCLNVVYRKLPNRTSKEDEQNFFPTVLLRHILKNSGDCFTMHSSQYTYSQNRAFQELANNRGDLTVISSGSNKERELALSAIYIPVSRGLLGYRVLVRKSSLGKPFSNIRSLDELANFMAGQGLGWPDTEILNHSGLKVVKASNKKLYQMLNIGRFDYYPRSILEVQREFKELSNDYSDLEIENTVHLYYKFPQFFFVNKNNRRLHSAIRRGFLKSYEDGSYMTLFRNYPDIKAALELIKLHDAKILSLPNPLLSNKAQAISDKYWEKLE